MSTPPPVVVFPDAEQVTVDLLLAALEQGTHIGTEWPDDLPQAVKAGVVAVTRSGGAVVQRYVLEDVTLDIDVLAADKGQAHDLVQLVRAHLCAAENSIVNGVRIYAVTDISLIWLPYQAEAETDPIPRYVLVMQMRLRAPRPAAP